MPSRAALHHASTAAVLALYGVLRGRLADPARAELAQWERYTAVALVVATGIRAATPVARSLDRVDAASRMLRLAVIGLLTAASPAAAAWLTAATLTAVLLFPPPPRPAAPGVEETTPAALCQQLEDDRRAVGGGNATTGTTTAPRPSRLAATRRLVLFYDPAGGATADATGDAVGRLAAKLRCDACRVDAARWPRAIAEAGVRGSGPLPVVALCEGGDVVGVTPRPGGRAATSGKGLAVGLGVSDLF